jgi:Tol biopolymer transport system component
LLYRTQQDSFTDIEVALFDAAAGRITARPQRVDAEAGRRLSNPVWSTAGQSLAYRTAPAKPRPDFLTDGYDTIAIHAGSSPPGAIRLNHPCVNDWHSWTISWAPDMRSLLMSIDSTGAKCRGLYAVDATTGTITTVLQRTMYLTFGTWLPDGKSVVFVSQHRDVIVRDVEAGTERTILNLSTRPEYENGTIVALALSHDGRSVALVVRRADDQSRLVTVDLSDGGTREVTSIPGFTRGWATVAWTPDDRALLFVENPDSKKPGQVWRVPAGGGASEPIGLSIPPGDHIASLSIRADSGALAFERDHVEPRALFIMENVLSPQARSSQPGGGGFR